REAASEALDFERASALHKRIEKVSGHLRGMPEIARRIDDLNAVILQRAAEEKTVIVFPVLAGLLREPVLLRFAELASEPRSVEAILRAALEPKPAATEPRQAEPNANPDSAIPDSAMGREPGNVPKQVRRKEYGLRAAPPELPEHLSLVARWFYSKPRDGEIFFRESDWPYRRILRACSRLLAPPEAQTPEPPTAPASPSK